MKKILLIEKDEMVMNDISNFLKSEGYDVIGCSNLHDGLIKLIQIQPDMLIVTISTMDSENTEFQICKSIKEVPATAMIPIICIVSNKQETLVGTNLGADDFLQKPFSFTDLLRVVNNNLRNFGSIVPVFINRRK